MDRWRENFKPKKAGCKLQTGLLKLCRKLLQGRGSDARDFVLFLLEQLFDLLGVLVGVLLNFFFGSKA